MLFYSAFKKLHMISTQLYEKKYYVNPYNMLKSSFRLDEWSTLKIGDIVYTLQ